MQSRKKGTLRAEVLKFALKCIDMIKSVMIISLQHDKTPLR